MTTGVIGAQEITKARISSRTETLIGAVLAALLGGFLIWGVGFSHIDLVHNAAHDARHSSGFPCH